MADITASAIVACLFGCARDQPTAKGVVWLLAFEARVLSPPPSRQTAAEELGVPAIPAAVASLR
jgi:hypothetical protein